MMNTTREFDKYYYYEKSVQNPSNEVEFFNEKYEEIRGKKALTLREDFCGTAAISCEWVKQSPEHKAWGMDLDPEPVEYGKNYHLAPLTNDQKSRMTYLLENVLSGKTPKVDICFAFNFSYFIFKQRSELLDYFQKVRAALNDDGVFFIDLFGGPDSQTVMTDIIKHDGFKYFWECQEFNPINNHCKFAIHIKRKGEKKRKNVFVYEWRMWVMSELRDLMEEAGFSRTEAYWEGDDEE
ncbi:MAG: class I SAM-dependent methyltransferase, partial [Halobacteriovoraceae bacterium]|nr:class I SAM-dependent methyltransferase [Halobacteriovoraceae bacterium]